MFDRLWCVLWLRQLTFLPFQNFVLSISLRLPALDQFLHAVGLFCRPFKLALHFVLLSRVDLALASCFNELPFVFGIWRRRVICRTILTAQTNQEN